MTDDEESRRIILLRRARFVAAALATATLAASNACDDFDSAPQPCLTLLGGRPNVQDAEPDRESGSGGMGGLGGLGGASSDASNERG
jgi:hypothetical protein